MYSHFNSTFSKYKFLPFSVLLLFNLSCGPGLDHESNNSPKDSNPGAPDLPYRIDTLLPGAQEVPLTEFSQYLIAGRIKVHSKQEIEKDFLVTAAKISNDAWIVSDYSHQHPEAISLSSSSNSAPAGAQASFTNSNGVLQSITLNDSQMRIHTLAEVVRNSASSDPNTAKPFPDISSQWATDSLPALCPTQSLPNLINKIDWPLKSLSPCIKDQAIRGTCTAFSTINAAEITLARKLKKKITFSEQGLYNQGKMFWPLSGQYIDGYSTAVFLNKSKESGYRFPLAQNWHYNPSLKRKTKDNKYLNSCESYSEFCSDTTHQGKLICAKNVTSYYLCGFLSQIEDPTLGAQIKDYRQLWNPTDSDGSFNQVITAVDSGIPVITDITLTTGFMNLNHGFLIPSNPGSLQNKNGESLGNHAFVLIGRLKNSQIKTLAEDKSLGIPDEISKSNEDYFIALNSWGTAWGDSGYGYIPLSYLKKQVYSFLIITDIDLNDSK